MITINKKIIINLRDTALTADPCLPPRTPPLHGSSVIVPLLYTEFIVAILYENRRGFPAGKVDDDPFPDLK